MKLSNFNNERELSIYLYNPKKFLLKFSAKYHVLVLLLESHVNGIKFQMCYMIT